MKDLYLQLRNRKTKIEAKEREANSWQTCQGSKKSYEFSRHGDGLGKVI